MHNTNSFSLLTTSQPIGHEERPHNDPFCVE